MTRFSIQRSLQGHDIIFFFLFFWATLKNYLLSAKTKQVIQMVMVGKTCCQIKLWCWDEGSYKGISDVAHLFLGQTEKFLYIIINFCLPSSVLLPVCNLLIGFWVGSGGIQSGSLFFCHWKRCQNFSQVNFLIQMLFHRCMLQTWIFFFQLKYLNKWSQPSPMSYKFAIWTNAEMKQSFKN